MYKKSYKFDAQQIESDGLSEYFESFLVKFAEHTCRFAARQGIALLIFHTNVSKFSH